MEKVRSITPHWVIFLIDILICVFSVSLAYLLRFNFSIPGSELSPFLKYVLPAIIAVRAASFIVSRIYAGIVRYASTKDAERILLVIFSGSLVFVLIDIASYYLIDKWFIIPLSIIILDFVITVFIMFFSRLLVKILYFEYSNPGREKENIIITGTDELALAVKRTFDNDIAMKYKVLAFVDPDETRLGSKIDHINIYPVSKIEFLIDKYGITTLVFAGLNLTPSTKNEITDICIAKRVKLLTVPSAERWINGELSAKQLKEIRIEDLLEREPITLNIGKIKTMIEGKPVMVTGAAGSIGREIVIQLIKFRPDKIVLYDQAETPLNDLSLELTETYNFRNFKIIIGDLTNIDRLTYIIERYKPKVIYHAGAYKHVPMMEINPAEAVQTNIMGTKILAGLAHKYKIERFVFVSTDKAVNPTNVMGASKRVAEIFIQSLGTVSETRFITTRFGNVLGSSGSVIPRFRAQIEKGGPVTVTHPDITRYFMTIPEACQLVLEAGMMGNSNEIFIFDMGRPIKIYDLAEKMISLSGFTVDKEIKIVFTGLRPGEKIYEELLNNKENSLPTHHPQILIAKVRMYDFNEVEKQIDELLEILKSYDNYKIVGKLKEIVPEFISENSVYASLDKQ